MQNQINDKPSHADVCKAAQSHIDQAESVREILGDPADNESSPSTGALLLRVKNLEFMNAVLLDALIDFFSENGFRQSDYRKKLEGLKNAGS